MKPNTRSHTNAKAPEVTTTIKKNDMRPMFDGVVIPQRTVTMKPVEPRSVTAASRAPIEREMRYVLPPKRVQFEKPPIEVEDDSDMEDEDEAEMDCQILEQRKMVRDDPPHLFEPSPPPVPISRPVPAAAT